jgi:hypothetical protein
MAVEFPPFPLTHAQIDFINRLIQIGQVAPADAFLTSWFRDPEKNKAVGGAQQSRHLFGLAVDVDLPTANLQLLRDIAELAFRAGLSALIYWGGGKSYVHLQDIPLKGGTRVAVRLPDEVKVLA